MDMFWQELIIIAAVVLSCVFLVIRYIRRKRAKIKCTNCPLSKQGDLQDLNDTRKKA